MIPDFFMLLIVVCFGTVIIGFFVPLIAEKTYGSKMALMIFIAGIIIICFSTVHTRDCRFDYITECKQAHALNQSYNFCFRQNYTELNFSTAYCNYSPIKNCNDIPSGCINISEKHIDGYCIPFTSWKYSCWLFNKA
jgi:hypothetical protein